MFEKKTQRKNSVDTMTEFDNDDNDTVIPDDFREMHVSCSRNKTKKMPDLYGKHAKCVCLYA